MFKMKNIYFYLYYKLYRSYERGQSVWLSEWKATLTLDFFIYIILSTLFVYYKIFVNRYAKLSVSNFEIFLVLIISNVLHFLMFHHNDKWKIIIQKFDSLPKKSNVIGGWAIGLLLLLILANFVLALYLMSQIDWSPYR